MTADDAREVLPAWGDIKEELSTSGVKISDKQAQDLLDYLIKWIADDLDDEDEFDDEEIDGELESDLEDEASEDVDRA